MGAVIDTIGWIGVALYVTAYYFVSTGRLSGQSRAYQVMNIIAAAAVGGNAAWRATWPATGVNVLWFGIGVLTLFGFIGGVAYSGGPSPRGRRRQPRRRHGRPQQLGRLIVLLALFGFFAMTIVALLPKRQPAKAISIQTSAWQPFVDSDAADGGPVTAIVKEVLQRAGYRSVVQNKPSFGSIERDVAANRTVAAFPFIKTAARSKKFLFSEEIATFEYVLFYKKGAIETPAALSDASDLKPYTIGLIEGYEPWDALERAGARFAEEKRRDAIEAFTDLDLGKIDFVLESRGVGQRILRGPALPLDASDFDYLRADPLRSTEALHLITTSAAGEKVRDDFNKALAEFKQSSRYQVLSSRLSRNVPAPRALVYLRAAEEPLFAKESISDKKRYRLPQETRAMVLEWPAEYTTAATPPAGEGWCEVKILDGPLTGRRLFVLKETLHLR